MPTQFDCQFDTDNDALLEAPAVADILRHIAERLEAGQFDGGLYDLNGNKVGAFYWGEK